MTFDPIAESDRLIAEHRVHDAVALIEREAAAGNDKALFRQAIWKLSGQFHLRDVAGARSLLRKAMERGSMDATLIEIALRADGGDKPGDWAGARELLEGAAQRSNAAANQLALLERMSLTKDGDPRTIPVSRRINDRPAIWLIEQMFSPDECLHVAQCAVDLLQPAVVVDPATGRQIVSPVRTSDGAVIGPTRATLVIQALNRRIAAATDTAVHQGEALSVLRYNPGQQFRPHIDAIDGAGNQRIKTVLIYLNHGFSGGATFFGASDFRTTPRMGDAVIFDNVRHDGSIDPATEHAGEPVTTGTKWLATRWIRARSFNVWTGPEYTP